MDRCYEASVEEDIRGTGEALVNLSRCQSTAKLPGFSENLDIASPLVIGGFFQNKIDLANIYGWTYSPNNYSFNGCLKNLMINGNLCDLANPGIEENSQKGCPLLEEACRTTFNDTTYQHNRFCSRFNK